LEEDAEILRQENQKLKEIPDCLSLNPEINYEDSVLNENEEDKKNK
jgi:hypothetical protein